MINTEKAHLAKLAMLLNPINLNFHYLIDLISCFVHRLTSFLNRERARRVIKLRSQAAQGYGYFTHCAALCCLLAISVVQAPLLYDLILVYRASLDGAILACILGTILHLFLWVSEANSATIPSP